MPMCSYRCASLVVLEKLDAQAINIGLQRANILATLKRVAPNFVAIVDKFLV